MGTLYDVKTPHRAIAALFCASFLFVSCGGSEEVSDFVPPADESYPAQQVEQGQAIYQRYCQSCHKADGSGQVGPNLRQVWERLSFEEEVEVIAGGRNQMPKFEQTLTPEEIEDVVAYTRVGW